MNAVAESRLAVTVALLGPNDSAREQLRNALRALGADLVFEGELSEAGGLSRRDEPPAVLIVNLEPGVEDELDSIQSLLDHPETSVVFNEGEVSSQLTGWDLARWARHLASKVLGVRDTLPPAPSGAERLPVLDLVPEPGRPASPAQQQDHLEFDTFADEVFERQDQVPSSPRLDQVEEQAATDLSAAALDFDFSPVASVSAVESASAEAESESTPADEDHLEHIDLSAVFEQGFDQLTPEDLLARLQMAMGLDPVVLPEDRVLSSGQNESRVAGEPSEAHVALGRNTSPGADSPLDEEAGEQLASRAQHSLETDQSIGGSKPAAVDQSALLDLPEFAEQSIQAESEAADPDGEQDGDSVHLQLAEPTADSLETPISSVHGFDPVSAEFDFEMQGEESESVSVDRASASSEVAESFDFDFNFEPDSAGADESAGAERSDSAGLSLAGMELESDELEHPQPARDSKDYSLEDSALGGTLSLEANADDDEIERMSAALDAQAALAPASVHEEFDFSRPKSDDAPAASSSMRAAPKPAPEESAAAPKSMGFGELSLTPMDENFIDPSAMAPLAEPPVSTFDFSSLSLSLEPIAEDDSEALSSKDPNIASVATMRDGTWLRDIGEQRPQEPTPSSESARSPEKAPAEEIAAAVQVAPKPVVAPALTQGVSRVIVLCASIGGPDALRSFLAGIPEGFPAAFLVVQHLESGYFERLAQQLQKASKLSVTVPVAGRVVRDGEVLVVTSENRLRVTVEGEILLDEVLAGSRYHPCIDDVLRDISREFGANSTAIIFSGMAADAIEGAVELTQRGGEVWAQDPESCVVSSMVDGARARGVVEYVGSPRELAERCVRRFGA